MVRNSILKSYVTLFFSIGPDIWTDDSGFAIIALWSYFLFPVISIESELFGKTLKTKSSLSV